MPVVSSPPWPGGRPGSRDSPSPGRQVHRVSLSLEEGEGKGEWLHSWRHLVWLVQSIEAATYLTLIHSPGLPCRRCHHLLLPCHRYRQGWAATPVLWYILMARTLFLGRCKIFDGLGFTAHLFNGALPSLSPSLTCTPLFWQHSPLTLTCLYLSLSPLTPPSAFPPSLLPRWCQVVHKTP